MSNNSGFGRRAWLLGCAVVLMSVAAMPAPASADTDVWDGKGDGSWGDDNRWSLGRPPATGDDVFIHGGTTQMISLTALDQANVMWVGSTNNAATVTIVNGMNTTLDVGTALLVGYTGRGAYNLSGGSLVAGNEFVGTQYAFSHGTGVFSHISGVNTISGDLGIGRDPDANGTYRLGGSGNLSIRDVAFIGEDGGSGTLQQTGGA